MINYLNLGAGAAAGGLVVYLYASLVIGPAQYHAGHAAGAAAEAAKLDAASRAAQEEISNEADRFRFQLTDCRKRGDGWMFDFVAGECQRVERPAG